jgi:peroxiredoxin
MASLKVGDLAPSIDASTHDGKPFRLDALRGQLVVVYFYPRAGTPLCTTETRMFRDRHDEIASLGAQIVGISTDAQDAQCEFARAESVQFPLLADHDQKVARAYEVKWPLLGRAQRVTFVIDRQGKIAARIHHELSADRHVKGVIEVLTRLGANAPASASEGSRA